MVRLEEVIVARRGKRLLGPLSGAFGASGATAVIGPNGAGKTTLLRLLHGLERARGGRITWDAPLRQSFVFQAPVMLRRTVLENLALPLKLTGEADALSKASDAARRAGLSERLHLDAGLLSGGEKQKLALARALITQPEILFLDEPTSNLDGAATRAIEAEFLEAKARGVRLIFASHALGQVRRLAEHVVFLHGGEMSAEMPLDDFFAAPPSRAARDFIEGDIVG